MDMTRPCKPSYPFLAVTDNDFFTSAGDPSTPYAASNRTQEASSCLRFHMDNGVWDVIHKEVMDWRDSSWTSMNLPGNKTCENDVQHYVDLATKSILILANSLDPMSPILGRPGIERTDGRRRSSADAYPCEDDLCPAACWLFHTTTKHKYPDFARWLVLQ